MATLSEIAYDIMSNIEGTSRISDDSELSIDQVYFKIHTTRAMLIRQDQAKGRSLSDNITQTLPCLEVTKVNASECCNITAPCELYRTKLQLPRAIETYQRDLIVRVGGVDITGPSWNYISLAHIPWAGISKWTKDSTKWFTKGGYVYIINPPPVTRISVTGVFEDPTDLAQYPTCSGQPCFSNDSNEYPLSSFMVPTLKQLVLEDLMRMRNTPADNRGNEEPKVQNKLEQ
jgi:hypothetical protein